MPEVCTQLLAYQERTPNCNVNPALMVDAMVV